MSDSEEERVLKADLDDEHIAAFMEYNKAVNTLKKQGT